jgi:poly-beta-1,6-N-acetyl-D-glucosamine synthase
MPLTYILITPARNEDAFIEQTIQSVISQTVLPLRWIIVSDGSTDGTDEIVQKYSAQYHWIELVRMPDRTERHFAGKVHAFDAGYARVRDLRYGIIGNLDGDITFEEDYFSYLLNKFRENPNLGIAGTPFREGEQQYDYRFTSIEHVSGACQLFRRECFEEISGYIPLKGGGVDLVACITARMKGWETRTFLEKTSVHHRKMGTAKQGSLLAVYRGGCGDYLSGGHPIWEIFRSIYQMKNKPRIVGGLLRLSGFCWTMLTRKEKLVSAELVAFRRGEQMRRLRRFFRGTFIRGSGESAKVEFP